MTLGEILQASSTTLSAISDAPRMEAEILLAKILGVTKTYLHTWPAQQLTAIESKQLQQFINQRLAGEPLAYILGEHAFWDMDFYVTNETLIPRPETEILIEMILEKYSHQQTIQLMDLGTGCGAIALAIANARPNWHILATDISHAALTVAETNAKRHQINNVQFCLSDWLTDITLNQFDVIVSNPPYIAASDPFLEKNVFLSEPHRALIAKDAGFAALKTIIAKAPTFLKPEGMLLVEHGFQQGAAVRELFAKARFDSIETKLDLSKHERVTFAKNYYF